MNAPVRSRSLALLAVLILALPAAVSAQTAFLQLSDRPFNLSAVPSEQAQALTDFRPTFGDTLNVSLTLTNVGNVPPLSISIPVYAVIPGGGATEDVENITLEQVFDGGGPGPWIYTGSIPLARRPAGRNTVVVPPATSGLAYNGTLEVRGRNVIHLVQAAYAFPMLVYIGNPAPALQYQFAALPELAVAETGRVSYIDRATVVTNAAGQQGVEGAAEIDSFISGETLYLRLVDDDLNSDPNTAETITLAQVPQGDLSVNQVPTLTGDVVYNTATWMLFRETGPDTGVFLSTVETRPSNLVGGQGSNAILEMPDGSGSILFRYLEREFATTQGPVAGTTMNIDRYIRIVYPSAPTLTTNPVSGAVVPGRPVAITVTDSNLGASMSGQTATVTDTFTVTVRAVSTVDSETVVLGAGTGRQFSGSVVVTYGAAGTFNDGVLTVSPAIGSFNVEYPSRLYFNQTGTATKQITQTVSIAAGLTRAIAWVNGPDGATAMAAANVLPNDTLFVRVDDPGYITQATPGTSTVAITVDVTTAGRSNPQTVIARELPGTPGRFVGQIPLAPAATLPATDGTLHVQSGDVIRASFTDSNGVVQTTAAVPLTVTLSAIRSPTTARLTIAVPKTGVYTRPNDLSQLIAGAPVCLTVEDDGLSGTASITVNVSTSAWGSDTTPRDTETITLYPVSPQSAVFRACVKTNLGPAVANNGEITLIGGGYMFAYYVDPQAADGSTVTIHAAAPVALHYADEKASSNVAAGGCTLTLANNARMLVPERAASRSVDVKFELHYGQPILEGGANTPTDEAGNSIPLPLNPAIQLVYDQGRPMWYEIKPSGETFKTPVTLYFPVPTGAHLLQTNWIGGTGLTDAQKAALKVVFFDGMDWVSVGGKWYAAGGAPGAPDGLQEFVLASTNHLTTYALAVDTRTPPPAGGALISGVAINNNPFTPNGDGINDTTTVQFALSADSMVTMRIFDTNGDVVRTLVKDTLLSRGYVSEQWDGSYAFSTRRVPTGNYIVEIRATDGTGRKAKETLLVGVMK